MLISFFKHQSRAGKAYLGLDLPARAEPADDGFDARPRSVRDWVANLPLINIGETGRQLLSALTEVNRTEMSARSRFQFLEQVRAPAHHVAQSLKKHYVGLSFPLSDDSAKVASLAWVLQSELALGYKIVIEEAVSRVSPVNRKTLVTAIHRVIRYLGRGIIICCDTYRPAPARVWSELHRLYRYAEQQRLHAISVHDAQGQSVQSSSIGDAYKQILLLALTDPYRLPQAELERVYAALEQWAGYVSLVPATDSSAPRIFMVNLDRDEPAGFFTLNHGRLESCRLIDTTRLVGLLQEQLSEQPSASIADRSSVTGLSRSTLERLHLGWRAKYGRKDPRIEKQRQVEVVMGLTALHHFHERACRSAPDAPQCLQSQQPKSKPT